MWKIFFALFLASGMAFGAQQSTAYDALLVVGNQFSRAALQRIISVHGTEGDPQPTEWTVLVADRNLPSGVRELRVADGRIIANREGEMGAGSGRSKTIRTAQLNLDSDGAFTVTNYTADKSHTNFNSVDYTLRLNDRGMPVWVVTILDHTRAPVGTIHISANRGNVTRVEGMYRGANMANVQQDPAGGEETIVSDSYEDDEVYQPEEDENVVKVRIKQLFYRTKRDAQRLFLKARRPFDEFIARRSR